MKCTYIDAGTDYFAWALFEDGELQLCGKATRDSIDEIAELCGRESVIVEKPFVQQDRMSRSAKQRSSNQQIQELCIAVGEYGGAFRKRKYMFPYTAPKDIRHARALAALRPQEIQRLPKFITHQKHVLCAVYIGLRDQKRTVA